MRNAFSSDIRSIRAQENIGVHFCGPLFVEYFPQKSGPYRYGPIVTVRLRANLELVHRWRRASCRGSPPWRRRDARSKSAFCGIKFVQLRRQALGDCVSRALRHGCRNLRLGQIVRGGSAGGLNSTVASEWGFWRRPLPQRTRGMGATSCEAAAVDSCLLSKTCGHSLSNRTVPAGRS